MRFAACPLASRSVHFKNLNFEAQSERSKNVLASDLGRALLPPEVLTLKILILEPKVNTQK